MGAGGEEDGELATATPPCTGLATAGAGVAGSGRDGAVLCGPVRVRVELPIAGRGVVVLGVGALLATAAALRVPRSVFDVVFEGAVVCDGALARAASTAPAITATSIAHVVVASTGCPVAHAITLRSFRPAPPRGYTLRQAGVSLARPANTSSIRTTNSSCESSCSSVSWRAASSNPSVCGASVNGWVSISRELGTCLACGSSNRHACCTGRAGFGGGSYSCVVETAPRSGLRRAARARLGRRGIAAEGPVKPRP